MSKYNEESPNSELSKLCRIKSEELVNNLKLCLESRDFDKFDEFFDPKAVLNRCNEEIIGRNLIKNFIEDHYLNEEVKLYKVRVLIDSQQRHIAVEWITRRREIPPTDESYIQGMASWYLKLSPNDNTIRTWYIWIDRVFDEKIPSLDALLPQEIWKSSESIQFYSRKEISEIIRKRTELFENENLDAWKEYIAEDVIIRPPWNNIAGKQCCIEGAKSFFEKYEKTSISKIELLYDETHPNWCVYIQLFSTSERESGKRGQDFDFVFNEIVDGKVRYWRSYFNTNYSQEFTENNFKFFINTISKYCENDKLKNINKSGSSSGFIGSGKD